MTKELFRIAKAKTTWVALVLVLVCFFTVSTYYASQSSHYDNHIYHQISEYGSIEEIKEHIAALEAIKENTKDVYISQTISIYNYLYENNISFDAFAANYAAYMGMHEQSDNRVVYSEYMLNFCFLFVALLAAYSTVLIISGDFSSSLYKNIFGTNQCREDIIRRKVMACVIFALSAEVMLLLFTWITSNQFDWITKKMICFSGTKMFVVDTHTYVLFNYISQFIDVLLFVVVACGVALATKNTYVNIFADAIFLVAPYGMSALTDLFGEHIYAVRMGLINAINGYHPMWIFALTYGIKACVSILCIAFGIVIYKKRNI